MAAAALFLSPRGQIHGVSASSAATVVDGVAFARQPHTLYAPVRAVARSLDMPIRWDRESGAVYLDSRVVPEERLRALVDGTRLIQLRALEEWDVPVRWVAEKQMAHLAHEGNDVWVRRGEKRVAISLDAQHMRAWQGDLLVLDTRVSTGRASQPTPTGSYTAGPLKRRLLISRKYGNARMPWSVQIYGDYVIHGFRSVPPRAASHGCVRVPLTGQNPAKWFYQWVEVGTPILIRDGWPASEPTA
jgi:lipoprotein-anchoring transpeptidase ErfK/SrfK